MSQIFKHKLNSLPHLPYFDCRACPGQQMAMLEGVFYLALLVQKYDFHLVDPSEVIYNEALTLQMKNGLRVRVKKKSQ
ncbi:hypothetical protein HMI54_014125 [Coelomomyces lativittatus]|nr:hypothetical protein HMI54_014125 [Coelomomyces lativittatus]